MPENRAATGFGALMLAAFLFYIVGVFVKIWGQTGQPLWMIPPAMIGVTIVLGVFYGVCWCIGWLIHTAAEVVLDG